MNANQLAAFVAKQMNVSMPVARAIVFAGVEAFLEAHGRPDLAKQVQDRFSK